MNKIIIFYKYINISNPEQIVSWQKSLCESLNIRGRIFIAQEGINGTIGGTIEEIEKYKNTMNNHDLFNNIDFKENEGNAECFPKLKIIFKKTIVNLGIPLEQADPKNAGIHLTPEEVHNLITQNPNLLLLDTRNDYESKIGTFINAIIPNTKTFRDFPQYIDNNIDLFKEKEVLMFCTAGIRCERASAYLNQKNIAKKVYQIKGGIHRYIEKYPNGYFKGKNYVFDGRISIKVTDDILSNCEHCKIPYNDYTNCINAECNRQIIVCQDCIKTYHNTCSSKCMFLVHEKTVNIRTKPNKIEKTSNQ